jgi:hypothetical protein
VKKIRYKLVKDLIAELQKLPQQAKISIEVWDRNSEEWSIAEPTICRDQNRKGRFVVSYDPELVEGKLNG